MNFESKIVEISMDLNLSRKSELPRLLREMANDIEKGISDSGGSYYQWEVNG